MKKITLLVFLVFFAFLSSNKAQKKKKVLKEYNDFIVTISGDTIYGHITGNLTPALMSVQISFIDNETRTKTLYRAKQIKSWHPAGADFYFVSKEYRPASRDENAPSFAVYMKCLTVEGGAVKLYEYYNTDQLNGYTQSFLERRGEMTEVKFGKFRKQMAIYFEDYEALSTAIRERKYRKRELSKIIETYNLWKNKNE